VNETSLGRQVSLDFRIVPSRRLWNCLVQKGNNHDAKANADARAPPVASEPTSTSTSASAATAALDPYGAAGGYYAHFTRPHKQAPWQRVGLRPEPDKRMGFPFVKPWYSYKSKQANEPTQTNAA